MIIDAHTHIGQDKDGSSQTLEQLKSSMKQNKIDAAIIFPFDEKYKDVLTASLELAKYKSGSLIPFLRIDPRSINATDLKKLLNQFAGVKLHPRSQNFDPLDKSLYPLYAVIAESKKPLLIHTRKEDNPNTDPDRVALLAEAFPKLSIILAHFAAASSKAIELVGKYKNLYIDTSVCSSHWLIEHAVKLIGADKIIYGSDSPYSDQEIELLKIKKANISEEDREKILHKNIIRILGW